MNIELIKTEISKLSQIVASWNNESHISAIEKELILSKLQNLYEIIRFDTPTQAEQDNAPAASAAVISQIISQTATEAEGTDEPEVEVEFLFDEDEDEETNEDTEPAETEAGIASDNIEPEATPEPASEEQIEKQIEEEPDIVSEPEPEGQIELEQEVVSEPAPQTMGNLFGIEEPKRHTRSKHLRMMSLYDDSEPATPKEKSINVSKIFNLDIDDIEPVSKEDMADENLSPEPIQATSATIADASEQSVTLADTIAPNQPTLGDTISRPAPLAEEITNSKISSLHDGVGINDKFLMIRDLFDGDEGAYKKALQDLDAQESFDDCMIYIVENFAWNPDSEGAKFIMKLLERKHS